MPTPEKEVFIIAEVARLMGFSRNTISRRFEREPGVLIVPRPGKLNKRRYRSMRIPRAIING